MTVYINILKGCDVDIWEDANYSGDHFVCDGNADNIDVMKVCDKNDLGSVGPFETSAITCNCPGKIQFIYPDINYLLSINCEYRVVRT